MLRKFIQALRRIFGRLPWGLLLGVWIILVFALSSIAAPELPEGPEIPFLDKVAHFVIYAAGAVCVWHLYRRRFGCRWFSSVMTFSTIAFLGGLDEYYQTYIPGRSGADVGDWAADLAGAAAAILILLLIYRSNSSDLSTQTAQSKGRAFDSTDVSSP